MDPLQDNLPDPKCSPWRERFLAFLLQVLLASVPGAARRDMTSLRRCVKCMFIDRLLVLLVFAVSVAESDVSTDVALAIDLAATGSHHHVA